MNPAAVLAQLKAAGIHVAAVGGKLVVLEGPEEVLNEDVLNELSAVKAELIKLVNATGQAHAPQAEDVIAVWRNAIRAVRSDRLDIARLKAESLRFLDSADAVAAVDHGWDALSLFGMHEGACPRERIDCWGLVLFLAWGVHSCTVESINTKVCALRTRSGAVQTLRCNRANFDHAIPWWEHPGIATAEVGDDEPECA